jgi:DNA polymerase-3 subunit chi
MTRVDFYILQQDSVEARMLFVCRLVDKALRHGKHIMINVADQATAEALDDLLWSFRPESYIAHAIAGTEEAEDVPVVISVGNDLAHHHDVLINLTNEVPSFFSRFQRLIEVVVQVEELLQATRQHYAFFKQRGYPIQTHKLAG